MNTKANSTTISRRNGQPHFSPQTTLVALRCWWYVALPVALLVSLLAGATVIVMHRPTYTAEAWLLIKSRPDVVLRDVNVDPGKFIPNQMEIIRSPRLLGPIASKPEVLETPELQGRRDVVATLAEKLKIVSRGESEIYIVSFSSVSPEKAELIVREVTTAYLAFNRKLESEQNSQIIRLLEDQRVARYKEMLQLRDSVRSLSIELTGVDPYRTVGSQPSISLTPSPTADLQTEIIHAEVEQDVLAARITAEKENRKSPDRDPTPREIDQAIEESPAFLASQLRIDQLKAKEAKFLKTGLNVETNPHFLQLRSDLAAETQHLVDLRAKMREDMKNHLIAKQAIDREERLASLEADYQAKATRLKVLTDRFKARMGSAKDMAGDQLGLEFQRAKLEQVTRIHDEIASRILALTTEQSAPDRVMTFKEPTRPIAADQLVPWKKLGLATGAAFVLPFAFIIGWEHLFKRVGSPSQLEGASQLSVVREVTTPPKSLRFCGERDSCPKVRLYEESVESLWAHFTLAESLRDHRVLALTSAVSREGKTSLSSQLAVSIARESGEPTLLIDGDLRSPDLHDLFGVELRPGLAELLAQQCDHGDAIKPTLRENLFLLPAGQLTVSPRRLLRAATFQELLQTLRRSYRYIILDTPPILSASEALVIAHSADAAMLCLRCDYSRVDQVNEAHKRMAAAGANVIGGVLNGIPLNRYAFKYGRYEQGITPALVN